MVEQFCFPRPLCASAAERRQAVPGSYNAFRLLSCLLQVELCCDAKKNLLLLGFCGIPANAARRKHSLLGS